MDTVTIGLEETVQILHEGGLPVGKDVLMQGLRDGKFPFGFAVQLSQWRYYISSAKLQKFLMDWRGEANAD